MGDKNNVATLATEMSEQQRPKAGPYQFDREELKKVIDLYKERKYVEELDYITKTLGGSEGLSKGLNTSLEKGITESSLKEREEKFGTNYKPPPERTGFCELLLGALDDFMLKILIGCAIFQLVIEMSTATEEELAHAWIEGFAILLAVAVVSLVGAGSDYKKEGQFLKQQQIAEDAKIVSTGKRNRFFDYITFDHEVIQNLIRTPWRPFYRSAARLSTHNSNSKWPRYSFGLYHLLAFAGPSAAAFDRSDLI